MTEDRSWDIEDVRIGFTQAVSHVEESFDTAMRFMSSELKAATARAENSMATIARVRVEIEDIDRMAELSEAYGTPQGRLTAIALRDIADRLRAALYGVG